MFYSAWGKILGAFFGFSLAGPVGALFGILIGALFDQGLNYSKGVEPRLLRGQSRKIFHSVTFSVMGHIAKADGRVSEDEIRVTREWMKKMRLNAQEQREAIASFSQGKMPSFQLDLVLGELKYACRQNPGLLKMFVDIQYRAVATNTRRVNINKQQVLNKVFIRLGFIPVFPTVASQQSHERFYQQHSEYSQQHQQAYQPPRYVDELAAAYQLLECSERSTPMEIKKAYRKKISKHHPDKLIAKGLSEKLLKEGTEYAQKIQSAYEKIRQSREF